MKQVYRKALRPLLSAVLVLSSFALAAQEVNISGQVKEANDGPTIPGVNISVKGSQEGTTTDMDGNYSIKAQKGQTLVFSFVGFKTIEIQVNESRTLNVEMTEEASLLNEIVVVGYGSATKKEITGAAAKVEGAELKKLNISRVDAALQGQVSGVTINTNSGSPGGASSIRIRGLSTFGDNDPLILVDGIVYDSEGLNALNPNDIESVNVLKDGTAGIYGVRAANGVIIIETKKGKLNSKPQIEFSGFYGMQSTARQLNLLNATEYAVIKNNAFINGGQTPPFANTALGEGTDWQEAVFQNAPIESYNISINGGNQTTRYSIGGSYYNQNGIVGGDKANFRRYNARVNVSFDMNEKLRLNSVLLYTNEARSTLAENGIGSVLYNTINAYPTEPIRQDNGRYSYLSLVNDIINPLAQMENTYNRSNTNKFVGKEELVYTINEDFTLTNRFNYNVALVDGKTFSPLVWYGPGKAQNTAANEDLDAPMVEIADSVFLERGASVYENRDTYVDLTYEGFLNYDHTFNKIHKVKSTLGVSVFTRSGNGLNATAYNIPNNSINFADISANQADGGFLNNAGSFQYEERLLSSFLRAEYSLHNRYLFSAIVRRDGSSKFGANNRWGIFPAFSGAWIFSDEVFWEGLNLDWMDFGKLRMSYGISGNDQIPNFAYRALLNGEGVYILNDIITSGVAIGRGSNPDLKWETTHQFNVGLDFNFLRDLSFTFNYFVKNTQDLLFQPAVSALLGTYGAGGYPPYVNAGDVSNRGMEFELGYHSNPTRPWVFDANLNLTTLKNEVVRVPDGVDFIPGASFGVGGVVATRFEVGQPIGYYIGYETDGIFQTQAEIDNASVTQAGAKPGDLRFVDQNGDGQINFSDDSDKVKIGSPIPDLTIGFNFNIRYKGFDLAGNVYAALGQEIIRNYERQQPYANQLNYVINRWNGAGSTDIYPRVTTGSNRNTVFSDFYVEDGSFVRLRNIQFGYTLPKKWLGGAKVESLRIYISANNLYTLTNYLGYDPDIGNFGGTLAAGVDYGFYPQARTIMGGFNLKF
ncbi:SusC/RagA family TonB-linked outer membrane protein [Croceimicrobium hydrocarbonivorans]|uniref:TonB-dependent receptor n=1 Tax=Croceimicrobium hydrocarbonivorans TaxID=2761580 RepID=A0A7H0VA45_9FLAO|nr:TonB-dependent receptor [Croceimicrobium hydrocarbonivorans]QNR22593.1 TonB-dependent receptor [Croceimicrobium hydrocarbonivorans]